MDPLDIDLARSVHEERTRIIEERNRLDLRDSLPAGALVHTRRR